MKNKVPLKGKPNFTNFSDEKVKQYLKMIQDFLFAYERDHLQEYDTLKKIWHDLNGEDVDREDIEVASTPPKLRLPKPIMAKLPRRN